MENQECLCKKQGILSCQAVLPEKFKKLHSRGDLHTLEIVRRIPSPVKSLSVGDCNVRCTPVFNGISLGIEAICD
jgi:hypothetical protein